MEPNCTRLAIAPLTLALALAALTGCQAGSETTEVSGNLTPSQSPRIAATSDEPAQSRGYVKIIKQGTRDTIGGIVSWEAVDGYGVPPAQAKRLGRLADQFMVEHLLREDRWVGDYVVKPGEMDSYREKVAPALADSVENALVWIEKHVNDKGEVPPKLRTERERHAQTVGYLALNTSTIEGGKRGQGRFEFISRQVFKPTRELGWTKNLGKPVTYAVVKTRRMNNTGTGHTFSLWQAWKPTGRNGWRIVDNGWSKGDGSS